jgi:hypothetical protein
MIVVVIAAGAIPRAAPGNLHGRPGLKPRVMKLTTQAMRAIVLFVQITQPRLLADGKMNQANVFHGSDAAILAVLLLRQAFSNGILVLIPVITTGGTHIVPEAPIQFQSPAWMEYLKIVGHETLEGHGCGEDRTRNSIRT